MVDIYRGVCIQHIVSLGTFPYGNSTATMEYVEYQFEVEVSMLDTVSERYCIWELVFDCLWWVRAHTRAIHVMS